MIRILIADDHSIVRRGVRHIVSEGADMRVVGEARTAGEMLAFLRNQECDVVVLDISMPGRSGLEALQEVKRVRPRLAVLVLSMHPEDEYALRALRLGAAGYLTKSSAAEELVQAIRKVASGGRYVSPTLAQTLAAGLARDAESPGNATLSDREHEVLRLLGCGRSIKEVGEELSLSAKTVSTYRTHIMEKLHMKNNADIIHYAVRNRLAG